MVKMTIFFQFRQDKQGSHGMGGDESSKWTSALFYGCFAFA